MNTSFSHLQKSILIRLLGSDLDESKKTLSSMEQEKKHVSDELLEVKDYNSNLLNENLNLNEQIDILNESVKKHKHINLFMYFTFILVLAGMAINIFINGSCYG